MSKKSKASVKSVESTPPPAAAVLPWRVLLGILVVQLVLLCISARTNLEQLNHDAIAYLRIGQYYADGNMALAVSGYWGPLLSWLIACGIKLGLAPMVAGRAIMVFSSLVFQIGAAAFFRGGRLAGTPLIVAFALTALTTIFWSVEYLSPDLLLSGLMLGAWGIMFTKRWELERRWQIAVGVFWGLAYLSKAVAFPLAVVITLAVAGLKVMVGGDKRRILSAAGVTVGLFALVSLPWVATLSAKYGHFTFSTSGSINHSIVGPDDVERYHPVFRTFHEPDAGRVTQWEEPSLMDYKSWSPFSSGEYFRYQLQLVHKNFETVVGMLASFDILCLGFFSLLAAFYLTPPWKEKLATDRWRWSVIPIVMVSGIYLPVWVANYDDRYFYTALPVMLLAGFGVFDWIRKCIPDLKWFSKFGYVLVVFSFGLFPLVRAIMTVPGMRYDASVAAKTIAQELRQKNLQGPVAGSAKFLGSRVGFFTAYYLGEPWLGDREKAPASAFVATKARVLVLNSGEPAVPELMSNSDWERVPVEFPQVGVNKIEVPVVVFVRKK